MAEESAVYIIYNYMILCLNMKVASDSETEWPCAVLELASLTKSRTQGKVFKDRVVIHK